MKSASILPASSGTVGAETDLMPGGIVGGEEADSMLLVRPAHIDVHVLRHPVTTPVRTSFGTMLERPAVLVRVEDADGAHGWGEVWCNFPACGAEHRARLVETVIAPLLLGRTYASPRAAFEHITASTAVLALQAGEPGPLAQAAAGIDLALWDLVARRAGEPLWRLLGGESEVIGVYASGLNPDGAVAMADAQREQGHIAFKLKVGFDVERDLDNLARLRKLLGAEATLMADANQAWSLPVAHEMVRRLAPFDLAWLEEPLRADRPWSDWRALRDVAAGLPLAAGENLADMASFDALLADRSIAVVQPDVAKWGGISGCLPLARRVRASGLRYCPHYLGAGIGLLHSAHLLAAVGGDGLLEIDANENPLRTLLWGPLASISGGCSRLVGAPGIGIEPDLPALRDACARPAGASGGHTV